MLDPHQIVRMEQETVVLLDQRRLPGEQVDVRCETTAELVAAIRTLAVRGAPAIGIAAAYGYAAAARRGEDVEEAAAAA
jgi:methylthioribose-1-phosphate isomerase